jgi:hypothetical protein
MKYSPNTPLTQAQIKALPIAKQHFELNDKGYPELVTDFNGFTPTSVGFTGQQIKKSARSKQHPTTSRKATRGRVLQRVPILRRDEHGNLPVDAAGREIKQVLGYKTIWHRDASRLMNV